jgi:hypothetical protein
VKTNFAMQIADITNPVELSSVDVRWLAVLATSGLVAMWAIFWLAIRRTDESITEILLNPSFFKTVAVMGVIAATVVLSLAGRLEGNLTGAILSGIVGYVLGSVTGKAKESLKPEKPKGGQKQNEHATKNP